MLNAEAFSILQSCIRHSAICIRHLLAPPMTLRERVAEALRRHAPETPKPRVLVALSGGGDSVALLHIVRELHEQGDLTVAGAAHLHHGLRGEAADQDQNFCADLAARFDLPFVTTRVDVAVLAHDERRSVEDAARRARYAFLESAGDRLSADLIATGHTQDDQAETFLLRLLRGAGTRGLGGIRPRAGRVVRPLLDVGRGELRRYLDDRSEAFREDASNDDVAILRNRVRHELLPFLQSRFSPAITDVLARESALAQQDEDFLRHLAIETASGIVLSDSERSDDSLQLDAEALMSLPPALASRVAHDVLSRLAAPRPITFDHVRRLLDLAGGAPGRGPISLPGQHAERVGRLVVLKPGREIERTAQNSFAFPLSIPGEVVSAAHGWAIRAELLGSDPSLGSDPRIPAPLVARGPEVAVAAQTLTLPLRVRNRQPGDRFRPLGAPGVRKLQDFFVDRKVPRAERDRLPLVVDGQNRIVWVAGQSVAEGFRVLDPSQGVILLKVKRLGGPG